MMPPVRRNVKIGHTTTNRFNTHNPVCSVQVHKRPGAQPLYALPQHDATETIPVGWFRFLLIRIATSVIN